MIITSLLLLLIFIKILDDDSHYKFNFTWSPSVLRNGKNYTLYVSTDEKG